MLSVQVAILRIQLNFQNVNFTKGYTKKRSKKDNSPRNPGWFQAGKPSGRSQSQTPIPIPQSGSARTSHVRQTFQSSDCKIETTGNICTLRSQADLKREENKALHSGMRWIVSQLTLSLYNTTYDKHQVDSPSCPEFNVNYHEQKKVGNLLAVYPEMHNLWFYWRQNKDVQRNS
ncbi:unnamed protein product [Mytilus coruscus]|uniref:Uncharacterized protein n=1 Tax=Mytilus coruscus TaxID=42192 RepID=A0A6J8DZR2_MYTCO|nr:unnamed protein product [Mytilus coruscus]